MTTDAETRPCKFCVARWADSTGRLMPGLPPILPTADDCDFDHRDLPQVYALARELAVMFQETTEPSDAQVSWFLGDADDVVGNSTEEPATWRVARLPLEQDDEARGVEARMVINGVAYVSLEGGENCRSQMLRADQLDAVT